MSSIYKYPNPSTKSGAVVHCIAFPYYSLKIQELNPLVKSFNSYKHVRKNIKSIVFKIHIF